MKYFTILVFLLGSLISLGQITTEEFDPLKWEPPYNLDIPEGWGLERFGIPISFAPQIPFSGIEDIRFMPGWSKAESGDYWSYAFLWYLNGQQKITANTIENCLKDYYTGLVAAVGKDSLRREIMTILPRIKKGKTQTGEKKTFYGSVYMFDYLTDKPITLYCKVHLKSCEGQNNTFVFYEISPKPYTDKVWQSLDALWTNFSCEKTLKTN